MATPAAILSILVQADGVSRTVRQIRGMDDELRKADKTGGKTASTFKKVGAVVGGIVAFDTLKNGVKAAVSEFEEARKVGAQTQAVIKSTGGVANVTAKDVANLASAISKKVGVDDEAIQSGANLLLTFKNVRNELGKGNKIFDRATAAAVDLSAAGFGDLSATSKQLGKALNDPIKGISALSRSGVTFTQQQQDQIKALVENGNALKAQKIILGEVESQVKGSAAAQATALDKAKVAFGNLAEAAGAVLVPAIDKTATFMATLINQMIEGKSTGGAIVSVFKGFGTVVGTVATAIAGLIGWFKQHETVALALAAAVGVLVTAFAAMKILAVVQAAVVALQVAMVALNAAFLTNPVFLVVAALAALAAGVVVAYRESETFRDIVDAAWATIKTVAAWLVDAGVKAFVAVRDAVRSAWIVVRDVTQTVWNNGVKQFLMGVFTVLKTLVTTYFTIYKTIITTAWTAVREVTQTVWGVIRTVAVGAWTGLRDTATTVWDGIKTAILTPIRAARDIIGGKDGIWAQIKDVAATAWGGIKTAISKAADPILDVILAPFKAAVKGVAKFAKLILQVVGKIPGVDTDGPVKAIDKFTEGLAKGGVYKAFARGGAYARTGGVVSAPITLMGEEAPRHPEFVIPTNPAYRKRARGLLAQAAGAIGLAEGGVISAFKSALEKTNAGGRSGLALFEAGIVESGLRNLTYGDADSRGALQIRDSTARGMGVNNMDPLASALAFLTRGFWGKGGAIALDRANPGRTAGWIAQNVQGSAFPDRYDLVEAEALKYLSGKFKINGPLGNLPSPSDLIGKLPGVGDLPGWLGGLGKWVIEQVGDFITSQLAGVVGGGAGIGGQVSGTLKMARTIADKFGLRLSSGYRTPEHNRAVGGVENSLHTHGSPSNPGAIDLVGSIDAMNAALAWAKQNLNLIEAMIHDVGSGLHLHLGFFRRGGQYGGMPFVGSYATGGVVPQTGMAMVHRGETITPAGEGNRPLVHIEHMTVTDRFDEQRLAADLAWRLQTA